MYYTMPKPGHSWLELAEDGADSFNAVIGNVVQGVLKDTMPYNKLVAKELGAVEPAIKIFIETPMRSDVFTKEISGGRKLYSGSSPLRQIIDYRVRQFENNRKSITPDEIAEIVSRDTTENKKVIAALIKRMNNNAQLTISEGKVTPGVRHPKIAIRRGNAILEYQEGHPVHPVKQYIFKYVSDYDARTYHQIEDELMRVKWIKSPKTLHRYLREMVRDGMLDVDGDEYTPLEPPASMSVEIEGVGT